jgi:hypothetical protein
MSVLAGTRRGDLVRLYETLAHLEKRVGHPRRLADCSARMDWPKRGVYFFFEQGEKRSDTGDGLRVVRVGTHALKVDSGTQLWTRLSQHKGTPKTGGGHHRGSIFRLIVGAALINRDGLIFPTWGNKNAADRDIRDEEVELERRVSEIIGNMSFLWLGVEDSPGPESRRGYIERNSIGLLSNSDRTPLDPPSKRWLGHSCNRERVRKSGLWNQNHVDEGYERTFLDAFDRLLADVKGQE